MAKKYFYPNRYRIERFRSEDIKRTGITHTLILTNEDEGGNQRASGIIDNPSDNLCDKIKNTYDNNRNIKCYVVDNNSLITKLILEDEEFNF